MEESLQRVKEEDVEKSVRDQLESLRNRASARLTKFIEGEEDGEEIEVEEPINLAPMWRHLRYSDGIQAFGMRMPDLGHVIMLKYGKKGASTRMHHHPNNKQIFTIVRGRVLYKEKRHESVELDRSSPSITTEQGVHHSLKVLSRNALIAYEFEPILEQGKGLKTEVDPSDKGIENED